MEAFLNCILCRCSCLRFGLGLCIRWCQAVMVSLLASMSFSPCLVFFARSLLGAHSFALWRFLVDSRRPGWTSTSSNLGAGSPPRRRLLAIRPDMAFIPLCLFWKLQVPSGVSLLFPRPLDVLPPLLPKTCQTAPGPQKKIYSSSCALLDHRVEFIHKRRRNTPTSYILHKSLICHSWEICTCCYRWSSKKAFQHRDLNIDKIV
jgi:hypothetical protein